LPGSFARCEPIDRLQLPLRGSSPQRTTGRRFKRRSRDYTEDCDSLVVSGPLREEEAQAAAVSDFLSFVPFQILKRTRRYVET